MVATEGYPVRVDGELSRVSAALWPVKLVLAVPHVLCLAVLWSAFVVLTAVAFLVVLFRARYPRAIFDFNVGVLRWTWRVLFYGPTFGTDRFPPLGLADRHEYPARLHVVYPTRQRRGLSLLGWWLAGIPRYLLAAVIAIGCALGWPWVADWNAVLAANRWVISIVACAALLADEYPRLDGGDRCGFLERPPLPEHRGAGASRPH
jgi:Domain of unknown function (DUF4389)